MKSDPHRNPPSNLQALNRDEGLRGEIDVSAIHAAILREQSEPQEGHEPIKVWYVTFLCVLFAWGGWYLQRYSGAYNALAYNELTYGDGSAAPAPAAGPVDPYALGKRLFPDTCGKCHQANGQGVPGQYPPLAGSEWLLAQDPARIIRIVLDGLQGPLEVKGSPFNNQMVPWREVFNDQQIAAVLTHVRGEKDWGNHAGPVSPELVAFIRKKTSGRPATGPWTSAELKAIPELEPDFAPAAVASAATNGPAAVLAK